MKSDITKLMNEGLVAMRESVGNQRLKEYAAYVQNLIQAKEAGIDPSLIQFPMMTDRVRQGIDAAFAMKSDLSGEGGIEFSFIKLGGSYGKEQQESGRLKIDMEFMSVGAPDFVALQELSVDDLKKLLEVVEK